MNPLDIFPFDLFSLFSFFLFLFLERGKESEGCLMVTATTRAVNVPLHEPPPNYAQTQCSSMNDHGCSLSLSSLVVILLLCCFI